MDVPDYHKPISSKEPVRIFKSDFLEFFSHVSPVLVPIVWVPVVGVMLALSIINQVGEGFPTYIVVSFLVGLFTWTIAEYVLHRFVFHYEPKTERGRRLIFSFHGVHHLQPLVRTRLVMPPPVSIVLGALFYLLFTVVLSVVARRPHWVNPSFAGFALGYLIYDIAHYSIHFFNIKRGWLNWVRKHHMLHHVRTPNQRFGVTTPLWDIVFRTEPKDPGTPVTAKEQSLVQ